MSGFLGQKNSVFDAPNCIFLARDPHHLASPRNNLERSLSECNGTTAFMLDFYEYDSLHWILRVWGHVMATSS